MSKAKELARALSRMDFAFMDKAKVIEVHDELIDAVLSEPEPELGGWIEVGEKPNRKLISTTTERIYREGSYRHNGSGHQSNPNEIHMLLDGGKDYENLEISYDSIKQLIKEAS
jgi:hypothetical protein